MRVKHKTMAGILIAIFGFAAFFCSRLLFLDVPNYLFNLFVPERGNWIFQGLSLLCLCRLLIIPVLIAMVQSIGIALNLSKNQFFSLSTAERFTKTSYCFLAVGIIGVLVIGLLLIFFSPPLFEMEMLIYTTLGLFCAYFLCAVASQLVVEAREPRCQESADSPAHFTDTKL